MEQHPDKQSAAPKRTRAKRTLGSTYKRKGIYYIRFWHRGKEYRESSKSKVKEVALALLDKRRREIQLGTLTNQTAEHVTFDDLVSLIENDYQTKGRKSLDSLRFRLKRLRASFGKTLPVDITHAMLTKYVAARLRDGAKPSTVRYEMVALGRMYVLAIRAQLLTTKPLLPEMKIDNVRKGFFEPEEIARVLKHLPEGLAGAIEFAYYTGWRIGEIRKLTWAHVDANAGVVRLEPGETKNEDARTFPFAVDPALGQLILRQMEQTLALQREQGRIIPWVFHLDGEPIGLFVKTWKSACKAAGCPGKLVHDLRRTAVRNLERAGVARSVAMKLTGHRTEAVYRRYAIVSEADLTEAVKKLAARRSGS